MLDGLPAAEELVVGVIATVPAADLGVVADEVDPGQLFDLRKAELDLVAQRSASVFAAELDRGLSASTSTRASTAVRGATGE